MLQGKTRSSGIWSIHMSDRALEDKDRGFSATFLQQVSCYYSTGGVAQIYHVAGEYEMVERPLDLHVFVRKVRENAFLPCLDSKDSSTEGMA